MNPIAVKDLKPNTYFSDSVFLDEKFVLLSPDIPITPELTKRLLRWSYTQVQSDGSLKEAPALNFNAGQAVAGVLDKDAKDKELKEAAMQAYESVVSFLVKLFNGLNVKNEISINEVTEKVRELAEVVKASNRYIFSLSELEASNKNYIANHSAKTAILCLAMADYYKFPTHKKIELGMAALLHEIGMLKIPMQIYMNQRNLSAQEQKTIIAHPILGYRILKTLSFPTSVCLAVYEHHERMDGSGYPRRILGEKLSVYGRILAVASAYDAATSERPHRSPKDSHLSIVDILKNSKRLYDEKIAKALVMILSLFPIGTYVQLANAAMGVVVRANPTNPRCPQVKMLFDAQGNRLIDQTAVDTTSEGDLKITRVLSQEETDEARKLENE